MSSINRRIFSQYALASSELEEVGFAGDGDGDGDGDGEGFLDRELGVARRNRKLWKKSRGLRLLEQ